METKEIIKLEEQLKSPDFQKELQLSTQFKMNMALQCMFALDHVKKNTSLQKCSYESVIKSVKDVALLGLTLNPTLNQAYLVPRKNQCCLDIGYQGMITKLIECGAVKDIFSYVIYSGDEFEFDFITNMVVKYKPHHVLGVPAGEEVDVITCALRPDGYWKHNYMPISRVNEIMESTEAYKYAMQKKKKGEPYFTTWEGAGRPEMIKKTGLRNSWKFLPKNDNLAEVGVFMEMFDAANGLSDNTFTDNGDEIQTKRDHMKQADDAVSKVKDVQMKNMEDAVVIPSEIVEGAADELIELIKDGYKLPESGIRPINEVKEIVLLFQERGFTDNLMAEAIGNGGKKFKTYEDILYKGDAEEVIPFVIEKAYSIYLSHLNQ